MRPASLVVMVRCLVCGHRGILDDRTLAKLGIRSDAPIASFVKRLRCTQCGRGSVMANRVSATEAVARRLRA